MLQHCIRKLYTELVTHVEKRKNIVQAMYSRNSFIAHSAAFYKNKELFGKKQL